MARRRWPAGSMPAACLFWLAQVTSAAGQETATVRLGGTAVGLWTRAQPAVAGDGLSELYLTQPMLFVHAALPGGWLDARVTLNFEGITLRDGELAAGNAGEGYVDRRHPHTYLHEAVVVARAPAWRGFETSFTAGRGFAPFGTDDPMVRPFTKYPANHHLAQLLERLIVVAAVCRGPVTLEAGVFNGDEPMGPDDTGRLARFGDSWSARATVRPIDGFELQASHAFVASPEHVFSQGLDHSKWSASARFEALAPGGIALYGLLEWARTNESNGGQRFFTFESALAEVAARRAGWETALRLERTTRPEEERAGDPFRSTRPHTHANIMGITRWTSITGRLDRTFGTRWTLEPFIEASHHAVRSTAGNVFDPVEQFGSDRLWNVSLGVRVGAGAQHARMGRYGVALPAQHAAHAPADRPTRSTTPGSHEED